MRVAQVALDGTLRLRTGGQLRLELRRPHRGIAVGEHFTTDVRNGRSAYATSNGTSSAGPVVAGVAALVLAARPGLSAAELKRALVERRAAPGLAGKVGSGSVVNAYRARPRDSALTRAVFGPLHERVPARSRMVRLDGDAEDAVAGGVAALLACCMSRGGRSSCGFVWDDDYVTQNPVCSPGWLLQIWAEPRSLPRCTRSCSSSGSSTAVGLSPLGYHVDNVLLHGFGVARLPTVPAAPAAGRAAAGAVVLVHPVHVESVAWITERKNVLSLVCALLAASRWLRWHDGVRGATSDSAPSGSSARCSRRQ